jgi:flagellin
MRELAVQAANDVNAEEDREAIQREIHQLGQELDRIADTTNFNGKYVLSGRFQSISAGEYSEEAVWINPQIDAQTMGEIGETWVGTLFIQAGANTLAGDTIGINFASVNATSLLNIAGSGWEGFWEAGEAYGQLGNLVSPYFSEEALFFEGEELVPAKFTSEEEMAVSFRPPVDESGVWSISAYQVLINVIDGLNPDGTPVRPDQRVESAEEGYVPKTGIALISHLRSELGAVQNRLEHTVAQIEVMAENMQAAEARIRDVDMAKEMIEFTKNNILMQAATAMLAQANQAPQTVLQLLQ